MRFSSTGNVASGNNAGASEFAYNGTALAVGGVVTANHQSQNSIAPSWLSDTLIAYFSIGVSAGGPNQLRSYNTGSAVTALLSAADATHHAAGATIWAFGTNVGGTLGVTSNVPGATSLPGKYLGDVGTDDGSMAVILNGAASLGLRVYSAAGATTFEDTTVALANSHSIHVRGGMVAYLVGTTWQLKTVAGEQPTYAARLDPVNWLTPILGDGDQLFCLERGFDQTTLSDTLSVRYGDDPAGTGYLVKSLGGTGILNPDIVPLSGGILRIGWSTTTGEGAAGADIELAELKPAEGVVRYGTVSAGVFTWGAWATLDTTTLPVGDVQGLSATLTLPSQDHPFVDRAGKITQPWLKVLQNLNGGVLQVTSSAARHQAAPVATTAFTTATAGGGVLSAGTNPNLGFQAGPGIVLAGNPASNIVTISASQQPGAVLRGGDDGDDGTLLARMIPTPGPVGATGATGIGMPGRDGDDSEMPRIVCLPSSGPMLSTTVTIANADILTLPSTPVTLVGVSGTSFRWTFLAASLIANFNAAPYTNIDAAGYLVIQYSGGNDHSNYVANDASEGLVDFSNLFGGSYASVDLTTWTPSSVGWGNPASTYATRYDNQGFRLFVFNNGVDFSGGDALNTLTVTVYYMREAI